MEIFPLERKFDQKLNSLKISFWFRFNKFSNSFGHFRRMLFPKFIPFGSLSSDVVWHSIWSLELELLLAILGGATLINHNSKKFRVKKTFDKWKQKQDETFVLSLQQDSWYVLPFNKVYYFNKDQTAEKWEIFYYFVNEWVSLLRMTKTINKDSSGGVAKGHLRFGSLFAILQGVFRLEFSKWATVLSEASGILLGKNFHSSNIDLKDKNYGKIWHPSENKSSSKNYATWVGSQTILREYETMPD